jgi:tripartite-type tricarboxylate transporter receptor subunit TctC
VRSPSVTTRLLLPLCIAALAPACAMAQAYPTKPIRFIVTYPPGGPTDFVARAVGQRLADAWGQQVVIDNRGGAAGIIGSELAARAAPDGHTIVLATGAGMVIAPLVVAKVPYDPLRDFAAVSMVTVSPQVIVAHPSVTANTVKELIALAKAKPGAINFASVGTGSPNHLGGELLKATAQIDIVHVPYKGTSPAMTDLIAGQVQFMFSSMPTVLAHVKSGRLKLIATGGLKRSPAIADTPTVAETLPGFEVVTWYGVSGPAKMPRAIVDKMNQEIVKIVASAELRDRFLAQGLEPQSSSPEEMLDYTRREIEKWRRIVKLAGVTPQ